MKIVNLSQRTPEWHEWRLDGISASCCAVIMGENPDKTPLELWNELVGITSAPDLSKIPQVKRGQTFEAIALQAFEEKYGQVGLPICAESLEYPFIRASFDGVLEGGTPVEIKNLAEEKHLQVLMLREQSPAYLLYRWQVLHQLIVCGADRGYLWFWSPKHEPCCLVVERDEVLIRKIIRAEKTFWNLVEIGVPPEADSKRDLLPMVKTDESLWKKLAEHRREKEAATAALKAQLAELQKETDDLDNQLKVLVAASGFKRADAHGVKITVYESAGKVDWKALANELTQGEEIPSELVIKHQSNSSLRTRITVDTQFDPNKPAPLPRIRKQAQEVQPEQELELQPSVAGFWF